MHDDGREVSRAFRAQPEVESKLIDDDDGDDEDDLAATPVSGSEEEEDERTEAYSG